MSIIDAIGGALSGAALWLAAAVGLNAPAPEFFQGYVEGEYVRVGVPASVGDHLRVQSAGGAIYLRASEPIPPTRLQLQDVESGALILLDIAAEPAKDGQAPLEPVRIVEAEAPAKRYGGGTASGADEQADAPALGRVLGGGKRVRPALVYATGAALGIDESNLDGAACAVELIHAYSLVHDDLPAMDDDDLRRGRPTCHKAFDEATAILVGDSLQVLAFELLATGSGLPADARVRLKLVQLLAAGTSGARDGRDAGGRAAARQPGPRRRNPAQRQRGRSASPDRQGKTRTRDGVRSRSRHDPPRP